MAKRLGQHFLKNEEVIKKIVKTIDPQSNETVIEIGPGRGALTLPLVAAMNASDSNRKGTNLIAIEKDESLAKQLTATVKAKIESLEIITGDALIALTEITANLKSYKLVGNLPYYITGHLLRVVSELKNKPELCVFMVQKEVAERICDTPPKMNRLAASVQVWADIKIIASVPRKDFSPPPEVDSAVIVLKTKPNLLKPSEIDAYYEAMKAIFAQPRKTILNNLADYGTERGLTKEKLTTLLNSIQLDPGCRPQNLTIANIRSIAAACAQVK